MITQTDILAGLAQMNVRPTCCIMAHGSLSKFGHVDGGAGALVAALRRAAGDAGAVIVPSFRDAYRSDYYALRQCASDCPQTLCPSRERGYTGIIGETVREQPDALRSCHPTHSWAGVGGSAAFLLEGHRNSPTPCGHDSPFFRLMERDGVILLLGVGVSALTNVHAVEDARNVPYLSAIDPPRRHATYTTSGRRIQYRYADLLHDVLSRAGILRTTTIGQAACHAIGARDFGSFLWTATEDDPWRLVLRPRGMEYDPAADAARKCAAMLEAWTRGADRNAWRRLLDESRKPRAVIYFQPAPAEQVQTLCPAYRGVIRSHHRCAANDLPPWEKFEDHPPDEPGVATCQQCNWRPASRED